MGDFNTPYDDVFRTLLTDCKELIIPIVNEIFKEQYTGKESVVLKENELFLRQQNGQEEKRITDSSFIITNQDKGDSKHYHLECQSSTDGSMVVRMYEYDSQLALKNSEMKDGILHVNFPEAAILYLRHTKNTPDIFEICIHTAKGTVSYKIPVLKVKKYDIDTIFDKKLLFLIPFYIFTYEDMFLEINTNEEKLYQLKEMYADIIKRLELLCQRGDINEYVKKTICEMSERVVESLAEKYDNVKKGVTVVMGGTVLEYEAKTILRQGMQQGKLLQLLELAKEGILTMEDVAAREGISVEELKEKALQLKLEIE